MLKKLLSVGLVSVVGAVLFFACGKYHEQQQSNRAQEVAAANIQKVTLDVQGMTCSGCEFGVEGALKKVAGVSNADADVASNSAVVEFDPPSRQRGPTGGSREQDRVYGQSAEIELTCNRDQPKEILTNDCQIVVFRTGQF